MKKEIYIGIICALVILSVVIGPIGYFAGKGEREVVASNCGDVVCPDCPTCPDVNITLPDGYQHINITNPESFPIINITITESPDWGKDCTEYPTNYLVLMDDTERNGNTTNFSFHVWYYDNGLNMFERSPTFDNWTHAVVWVKSVGEESFTDCQKVFLIVWLLAWAYIMETGEEIGGP
ncbi:MAG: hypothetical protein ACXADO_00560 [Candidatus Thorarchaeota archaeon]|jgi:hypothetical protein